MTTIYIGSDNSVTLEGLYDTASEAYVNSGATVSFTLYRQLCTDAITTNGSTTVTASSSPFVSGDASRSVVVLGAGSNGSDLRTTISTYTSASSVVLGTAASKTLPKTTVRISVASATGVSMSYVTGSDGKYRGTIDDDVALKNGETYWVEVSVDAGSDKKDFRVLAVQARYRE